LGNTNNSLGTSARCHTNFSGYYYQQVSQKCGSPFVFGKEEGKAQIAVLSDYSDNKKRR
jgi:hypothetical protein